MGMSAGKKYGYGRVSTSDQDLSSQIMALRQAGIPESNLYTDVYTGSTTERPGLKALLAQLQPGDSVYIYKLDRLGRSAVDTLFLIDSLQTRGITLVSLSESLDSSTATGKLIISVLVSFAQFERDLIRERTLLGLQAAAERGKLPGRPKKLNWEQRKLLRELVNRKDLSNRQRAQRLGCSLSTYYRYRKLCLEEKQ